MNKNTERNLVVGALILVAGGVAVACPPEEGSSPDPAMQRLIERRLLSEGSAPQLLAYRAGQGSTLERRVYRMGESPLAQRYITLEEPGVVRVMRFKQDGRDVQIEERNGTVTAKLNGQDVPAERVTLRGDKVEIRDENGQTVFSETLPEVTIKSAPKGATFWDREVVMPAPGEKRAYMGITMDSASEDMVKHLGLVEGGEYAMIDEVYEGMPAEKAGLKSNDVIVSIDGKTPASPEAIRDVLRGKKAGETVVLEVVRKGGRQQIPVTLGEWSGQNVLTRTGMLEGPLAPGGGAVDWEKFAKEWAAKAEEWAKSGKDMDEWQQQFHQKMQEQLKDGNMKFAVPRGGKDPMIFAVPGAREHDLEEQLRVMEEQLKRMEEQMRRLERRLTAGSVAPVPPVPPVPPAPAGGGGGAPTPMFAWQL